MAARGRRPGLVVGYLIACAGSVLAAVAVLLGWYPLLILGILGIGTGNASNLAARYAAADLADDDGRAKAIGSLVWASTFGTVLGPAIGLGPAPRAADLIGLPPLVGPYLLCIVLFSGAALFIWQRLVPDPLAFAGGVGLPTEARQSLRTSVRMLAGSSSGRLAVLGMVAGHVVMVGVMTMTPLHMRDGNQDLQIVGFVISLHVIGMYAFSPVVGWFADRLGSRPVLATGGVLLFIGAELAAHTQAEHSLGIYVGLFLIGLGWSCGIIAGSALLTGSFPPESRVQVQGLADLVMTASGAVAGLSAGFVVTWAGFQFLGHWSGVLGLAPTVVVLLLGLARLRGEPLDQEHL
jgi:predicted MFS family arabinose efflux permease